MKIADGKEKLFCAYCGNMTFSFATHGKSDGTTGYSFKCDNCGEDVFINSTKDNPCKACNAQEKIPQPTPTPIVADKPTGGI